MKAIKVSPEEWAEEHIVGNKNCDVEWCACPGWPRECQCGGLIHAAFGDENEDCDYWLYQKCDRCGDEYKEKQRKYNHNG